MRIFIEEDNGNFVEAEPNWLLKQVAKPVICALIFGVLLGYAITDFI